MRYQSLQRTIAVSGLKVAIHPPGFTEMQGAFDRASGDFASFDLSVAEPLLCQGERAGNNACVAWAYMQAFGNRGRPHCSRTALRLLWSILMSQAARSLPRLRRLAISGNS